MPDPVYSHLDPELGPPEVDPRSIHAFWHGFPSPLVRWHFHHEFELHLIVASEGKVFVGDHVGEFAPGRSRLARHHFCESWVSAGENPRPLPTAQAPVAGRVHQTNSAGRFAGRDASFPFWQCAVSPPAMSALP